jgi:hypothetical protein
MRLATLVRVVCTLLLFALTHAVVYTGFRLLTVASDLAVITGLVIFPVVLYIFAWILVRIWR